MGDRYFYSVFDCDVQSAVKQDLTQAVLDTCLGLYEGHSCKLIINGVQILSAFTLQCSTIMNYLSIIPVMQNVYATHTIFSGQLPECLQLIVD